MKAIGIGHRPPGSTELNSAKCENHHGHVVQHGVGLATLVHPQSIVDVERLLSLLDQRKLLGNVVAKWIPGHYYNQSKIQAQAYLVFSIHNYFDLPVFPPKSCRKCLEEVERRRQNRLLITAMVLFASESCMFSLFDQPSGFPSANHGLGLSGDPAILPN